MKQTDFKEVMGRITPVSERPQTTSALFYGRSGTGKTALSATFPKPALLIDIKEKGSDTVSNVKGLDIIVVENWDEIEQLYWMLKAGSKKYKTVILDQVTSMQDLAIESVQKSEGKTANDLVSKRVWGQTSGMLKTWITNYRDLVEEGINIVFLAHDRATGGDEELEGQLDPSIGPRVMPSVASTLNGAVSIIGNTFIRERIVKDKDGKKKQRLVEFCLRIGPHSLYTTKVRRPVEVEIPDVLTNPSYEKILRTVRGESNQGPKRVLKRS